MNRPRRYGIKSSIHPQKQTGKGETTGKKPRAIKPRADKTNRVAPPSGSGLETVNGNVSPYRKGGQCGGKDWKGGVQG